MTSVRHRWFWRGAPEINGDVRDVNTTINLRFSRAHEQAELAALAVERFRAELTANLRTYLNAIDDPAPMTVRWSLVRGRGVDRWVNVVTPSGEAVSDPRDVAAEPPAALDDLVEPLRLYDAVPSQRLLVVGSAGSGKSVFAARLAHGLLGRMDGAIPVVVPVGNWDPKRDSLGDWLVRWLHESYGKLAKPAPAGGGTLAQWLMVQGHLLPILDGLDEMHEDFQEEAFEELNREPERPLVVAMRESAFGKVTADGSVLRAAAGVRLRPLDPTDVAAYLARAPVEWDTVLQRLCDDDPYTGHLRGVLTNPLMAALAHRAYGPKGGRDPAELLEDGWLSEAPAVEDLLLDGFVPASYSTRPPRKFQGEKPVRYRPERAEKWLARLSADMNALASRDLAWWRLADTVPPHVQVLIFAAIMIIWGALCGAINGAFVPAGPVSAALSGAFMGSLASSIYPYLARERQGLGRFRLRPKPVDLERAVASCGAYAPLAAIPGLLIGGVRAALVTIAATLAVIFFGSAFFTASDQHEARTPAHLLARSRTIALTLWLAACIAVYAGGFLLGQTGLGPIAALPLTLAGTAWGRWVLFTRLWLPLRGQLPWRVNTFLADAARRGVLRQAGAVYQFRHARLQDRLGRPPAVTQVELVESDDPVAP
ncbi:NACHT domain-containing protein [Streptomyces sp. NPDC086182]|uniref:NACHT domain-containing protein n=1 Tax=Streptomyces sp. NPDC086182 TaxID=3155058 RepID=UPI0034415C9B